MSRRRHKSSHPLAPTRKATANPPDNSGPAPLVIAEAIDDLHAIRAKLTADPGPEPPRRAREYQFAVMMRDDALQDAKTLPRVPPGEREDMLTRIVTVTEAANQILTGTDTAAPEAGSARWFDAL